MTTYDAIVVGARCAGSPTAMLLARRGHRVLLVDRDAFPSDALSTHWIHQPGLACLRRWGLLDQVRATGCPSLTRTTFDLGPFALTGTAPAADGVPDALAPRRYLLDGILVRAAEAAGAEVRQQFTVDDLLVEEGRVAGIVGHGRDGRLVTHRAHLVVGADGLHSKVARRVDAPVHGRRPPLSCAYYSYWTGIEGGLRLHTRPGRAVATIPTNDGRTCVLVAWRHDEADDFRRDVRGNYLATIDLIGEVGDRIRAGRREERITGSLGAPGFYRTPFGPGWALVGDAGYHKDPCTAQGITDAFHAAEWLSAAVHAWRSGEAPYDEALASYEHRRDTSSRPMYELTCDLAALDPPSQERARLFRALVGNQPEIDRFFGVLAGTVPVQDFFSSTSVERILAASTAWDEELAAP